jgi:hypothetical protein
MKTIAVAFLALFLLQIATSQSQTCSKGYINVGAPKCFQCPTGYADCNPSSQALLPSISGAVIVNNIATIYCPSPLVFNKLTNNC